MVTRIQRDSIIPSGLADATREPHTMRIANPEEGESRGETWIVDLRRLADFGHVDPRSGEGEFQGNAAENE